MAYAKWVGGLLLAALLLSRPQAAALGAAQAMARWYATVAPSLFPFLTLLPLLTGEMAANIYDRLLGRAMDRMFGLRGAAAPAVVVGMIAGTPAGAVAARQAAAGSGMNRGQLHRLAAAMAGFSPAFLIGGIGAGMLDSARSGWMLWIAQTLTQLTMLLLLRGAWRGRSQSVSPMHRDSGEAPVRAAALILLGICGYMALFGSVAWALGTYLGQGPSNLLLCLMDVPSGAALVAEMTLSVKQRLILLSGLCGFGGLCVIAQGLGALRGCGMKWPEYLLLRVLAAAISAAYMALMLELPQRSTLDWAGAVCANPLATAGMAASMMALPVLCKWRKSIS